MNVGLPDDCGDAEYLAALEAALAEAMGRHQPDFVHYVAGGDPFEGDRLGGLALTKAGLARRDRVVLDACAGAGLQLVATLAGGYAADTEDLVDIHSNLAAAMAGAP
jgi:acetoin utilization deacetylase AcuC-like enzyme